jgi:hypothetical protein
MPESSSNHVLWAKSIRNGLLAWLIAFILYMIPAFAVAIQMGFELGPTLNDSAAISRQISEAISEMYRSNGYLALGYIIVMAGLTFWRARVVAKVPSGKSLANATIVGSVPALITVVASLFRGVTLGAFLEVVIFVAAGAAGGLKRKPAATEGA